MWWPRVPQRGEVALHDLVGVDVEDPLEGGREEDVEEEHLSKGW